MSCNKATTPAHTVLGNSQNTPAKTQAQLDGCAAHLCCSAGQAGIRPAQPLPAELREAVAARRRRPPQQGRQAGADHLAALGGGVVHQAGHQRQEDLQCTDRGWGAERVDIASWSQPRQDLQRQHRYSSQAGLRGTTHTQTIQPFHPLLAARMKPQKCRPSRSPSPPTAPPAARGTSGAPRPACPGQPRGRCGRGRLRTAVEWLSGRQLGHVGCAVLAVFVSRSLALP